MALIWFSIALSKGSGQESLSGVQFTEKSVTIVRASVSFCMFHLQTLSPRDNGVALQMEHVEFL